MKILTTTCAALFLGAAALHAQVLLNIQVTSPDTMVITSTGLGPVTDDNSHTYFDGIDLLGLFTPTDIPVGQALTVVSSTLTTGDSSTGPIYDSATTDSFSESVADLNLYKNYPNSVAPDPQSFTFGSPAFAPGISITVNFTGLSFSGIDYGVILAGYSGDLGGGGTAELVSDAVGGTHTTPIGVYHVTGVAPEPSTYALMLGGMVLLAFCLRRKVA